MSGTISPASQRLEASRRQLRRHLMAPPEPTGPGQALAADWLSAATGMGGPPLLDSLKRWAKAEFAQRLLPPLRRHPLMAVAAAGVAATLLVRSRWRRPLLAALASQVLPALLAARRAP